MTDEARVITGRAAGTAVALLTARTGGHDLDQADLLAGQPPGPVIDALVTITATLLDAISPAHGGECILRALGMFAATGGVGRPLAGGECRER